jgi:hypothetical protein
MNELDVDKIATSLAKDGYYKIDNFIAKDQIEKILSDVSLGYSINSNNVGPVDFYGQTFFSNVLAHSRSIFNLISSKFVFDLSRRYLGSSFRLKCQRYYESGFKYQLYWHTDNQTTDGRFTDVRGLVFIIYLCDTFEGYLEVIEGSNIWSGTQKKNKFTDEEIEKNYLQDLRSLPGKAGTLVITDTQIIHHTQLISSPDFRRKSLFFQVDDDVLHSESMIINPEFFSDRSKEVLDFFGFGMPSGYNRVPQTNIITTKNRYLINLLVEVITELTKRIFFLRQIKKFLKNG